MPSAYDLPSEFTYVPATATATATAALCDRQRFLRDRPCLCRRLCGQLHLLRDERHLFGELAHQHGRLLNLLLGLVRRRLRKAYPECAVVSRCPHKSNRR
jgi:hypothetical protein